MVPHHSTMATQVLEKISESYFLEFLEKIHNYSPEGTFVQYLELKI